MVKELLLARKGHKEWEWGDSDTTAIGNERYKTSSAKSILLGLRSKHFLDWEMSLVESTSKVW